MSQDDKVRVKHIGAHARRADTMSGEGTVWHGPGDVQTCTRRAWENHLSKHRDLWVLVDEAAPPPASGLAAARPSGEQTAVVAPDYEAMDRPALAKLATERGITFDGRASKARLIELLTA